MSARKRTAGRLRPQRHGWIAVFCGLLLACQDGGTPAEQAAASAADVADAGISADTGDASPADVAPDTGPVVDLDPDYSVAFAPPEPTIRRLSREQYASSVRDVLGESLTVPTSLEPDTSVAGYLSLGAAVSAISARGVEQYEAAAYNLAAQVMQSDALRGNIIRCDVDGVYDATCARASLEPLLLRLWRRPATEEELTGLLGIWEQASTVLGDFEQGAEYVLAAALQSPHFLFRVELGEPDPETPGGLRFSSWEMASRLSYLLWNTTPDDELLRAAAADELVTDAGIQAQAERLLASPLAENGIRALFSEILQLHLLDRLSKDPTVFTHMSPTLGASAREEMLQLVTELVLVTDGDYRDVLTTRSTFVNRELAALYNMRAPSRDTFGRAEWPADAPRAGLLGQVGFLALASHPVSSSATLRGRFVRERLLCEVVAAPPANVDTSIPEPSGTTPTLRDRVAEHLTDPSCAGCHEVMDPIGLALENFDGIGRFRATDNGAAIDATGDLDGVPFDGPVSLALALRDHPRFAPCLVRHVYRYTNGRLETSGERELVRELAVAFERDGFRVRALLLELVTTPGFRTPGAIGGNEP
ncbi:MAG: DUF1592 domain-containing protein [Myxococcales bacterium]|nr:DUF1592 domain-containing protein [Myxococcales bacterium]